MEIKYVSKNKININVGCAETLTPKQESIMLITRLQRQLKVGVRKAHYESLNTKVLEKWLLSCLWGSLFVVYVSHTVNVLVTDIILDITSQENFSLRLFGLFSKNVHVCVKKQPGL